MFKAGAGFGSRRQVCKCRCARCNRPAGRRRAAAPTPAPAPAHSPCSSCASPARRGTVGVGFQLTLACPHISSAFVLWRVRFFASARLERLWRFRAAGVHRAGWVRRGPCLMCCFVRQLLLCLQRRRSTHVQGRPAVPRSKSAAGAQEEQADIINAMMRAFLEQKTAAHLGAAVSSRRVRSSELLTAASLQHQIHRCIAAADGLIPLSGLCVRLQDAD